MGLVGGYEEVLYCVDPTPSSFQLTHMHMVQPDSAHWARVWYLAGRPPLSVCVTDCPRVEEGWERHHGPILGEGVWHDESTTTCQPHSQ